MYIKYNNKNWRKHVGLERLDTLCMGCDIGDSFLCSYDNYSGVVESG